MSEEMIVYHCSPTLAGLKTGSMFSCSYNSVKELKEEIRRMNRRLVPKGLRVLPLNISKERALIYVYRPEKLKVDLSGEDVSSLLKKYGYICNTPENCIIQLISRLQNWSEFPHEIGVFLGYPIEDVKGFIENKAKCSKCVGYWKVYGDEEKAKELFDKYNKCTDSYIRQWINGNTIERLTVAV